MSTPALGQPITGPGLTPPTGTPAAPTTPTPPQTIGSISAPPAPPAPTTPTTDPSGAVPFSNWDDPGGDDARVDMGSPIIDKQVKVCTLTAITEEPDEETDSLGLKITLALAEKAVATSGRELFEGQTIFERATVRPGTLQNGKTRADIGWRTLTSIAYAAGTLSTDNRQPSHREVKQALAGALGKQLRVQFSVRLDNNKEERQRLSFLKPGAAAK